MVGKKPPPRGCAVLTAPFLSLSRGSSFCTLESCFSPSGPYHLGGPHSPIPRQSHRGYANILLSVSSFPNHLALGHWEMLPIKTHT